MRLRHWILAGLVAAAAVPAPAQQRIDRPGTVPHPTAGALFPERVGEFQRGGVIQYDAAGEDVSASYELRRGAGRLLLTIYVYPAPGVEGEDGRAAHCRRELDGVGQVIENQPAYRGARRVEDGAAPPVTGVDRALSLRSVHSFTSDFDDREQEVRSETDLYCYVAGRWLVKYRATSNAGFDASEAIEDFIREGPWPGRGGSAKPEETTQRADEAPRRG